MKTTDSNRGDDDPPFMDIEPCQPGSDSDSDTAYDFETTPESGSEVDDGDISKQRKRSLSDSATTASVSKKTRIQATSAIRSALESATPRGILCYFRQATEEEHQAMLARTSEEIQQHMEENEWKTNRAKERQTLIKREKEKMKKRGQRERKKNREITEGLRDPDGTKKRVSAILHTRMTHLIPKQGS